MAAPKRSGIIQQQMILSRRRFLTWGAAAAPASACLAARRLLAAAALTSDEYRLLPMRIHILQSTELEDLHCDLKPSDAEEMLSGVNEIWRQAGLQFYAEMIRQEPAAGARLLKELGDGRTLNHLQLVRPRDSRSPHAFHLYLLREMEPNGICFRESHELLFVKQTARLWHVEGGMKSFLPRVGAHEIGHALGLPHRQHRINLMASGTTGISLNEAEIETARERAMRHSWRLTPLEALARAERLRSDGDHEQAGAIARTLAGLPGGEVVRRAMEILAA